MRAEQVDQILDVANQTRRIMIAEIAAERDALKARVAELEAQLAAQRTAEKPANGAAAEASA